MVKGWSPAADLSPRQREAVDRLIRDNPPVVVHQSANYIQTVAPDPHADSEHVIHVTLEIPVFGRPSDDLRVAQRLLKHIHLSRPEVRMYRYAGMQSLPEQVTEPDPWAKIE